MKAEATIRADAPEVSRPGHTSPDPRALAIEVADVLGRMSFDERVRAYRSRAFTAHELGVAAAWLPDDVPLLNGEYEWIAIDLE